MVKFDNRSWYMLHIILGILRVIGILLMVVLGLVLLIALSVLLVPVRYELSGKKKEQTG